MFAIQSLDIVEYSAGKAKAARLKISEPWYLFEKFLERKDEE